MSNVPVVWVFVGAALLLAVGIAIGVATQRRKQLEAKKYAARLVELDALRDRYVAITSHEIRGPLTAIIAGIDAIRRSPNQLEEPQRVRLLDMIAEQGRQLSRLVDDLMISSELEANELAIQPEPTDLEQAVDRALEAAATRRRAHQLEVFIEPLRCDIDGFRVSQMMRNLIENAYKYTPDKTTIRVSGRSVEGGIELEVADQGPGIPVEQRDKLFEAFSRMRETAAGKQGVGLGLYVVSQLSAAMDAQLDLTSSTRGTTFTIRIPCRYEQIPHRRMGIISQEEA
jgi:signal transduction histidine kinase